MSFHEESGFYADSTFFNLFSFPLRYGSPPTALAAPRSIVLSVALAEKYFGDDWERGVPLGKTITFNGMQQGQFTVTGVMEDVPPNSHLQFDFLLSYTSLPSESGMNRSWAWSQCYTYVQLTPTAEPAAVENKLVALIDKYYDWGTKPVMFLQSLTSIHMDSNLLFEAGVNGSRASVYFLSIVGAFVLLIGWINYLNLTLAKSADRAKEVGVRKTMGAQQRHVIGQFVVESMMINASAAILAVGLVVVLQPMVSSYLAWQVPTVGVVELSLAPIYGVPYLFIVLFLAGSVISALYPAWVMTHAPLIAVRHQNSRVSARGITFRKALVVTQFAASTALIFGSLIVSQQLAYMQQYDLGMNTNQVLVLKASPESDSTYQSGLRYFKNEVNALASVEKATVANFIPGQEISHNRGIQRTDGGTKRGSNFYVVRTDEDFAATLQLTLIAGRNFSPKVNAGPAEGVILNEAAVAMLGYDSPAGALHQRVTLMERGDPLLEIIGIVENYHQQSLQQAPEAIVLRYAPATVGYVALRLESVSPFLLGQVQAAWERAFPGSPFDYFFLDDYYNRQYQADRQFDKVFRGFTALAILIASLGLFGLASHTAIRHTKEIGIRKVLGASVLSVLVLLSQEYIKLTGIALVIAIPLANYFFSEWLSNFAYRTPIQGWMFIVSATLVLLIALLTISAQTLRAAQRNPVDSLRDE
ncbi:MAG: ABC transporter permease [Tunicatimonas sp.]